MKIVIPAGGKGTRLLPVTKSVAKEMLPLTDRPLLQYLVEEAAQCGITEAIIVRSPDKRNIENHFAQDKALEKLLGKKKIHFLDSLKNLEKKIRVRFAVQKKAHGDGHALLCAKWKVGKRPFAIVFGDTLFDAKDPVLAKLMKLHAQTGATVVGVKEVPQKDVSKYGIVAIEKDKNGLRVTDMVEKPSIAAAPSCLALVGMYIVTGNIWKYLKKARHGHDGELRLADGLIAMLADNQALYACPIKEDWLDTGDYAGYFRANLRLAKRRPELRKILREEIK